LRPRSPGRKRSDSPRGLIWPSPFEVTVISLNQNTKQALRRDGQPIRWGVIGLGNMGRFYAALLREGQIPGAVLSAICDVDAEALARQPESEAKFSAVRDFLRAGVVDAVLVATPHPSHRPVGLAVLAAGLPLLMDKPLAMDKLDAQALLAAPRRREQLFGCIFQRRTLPEMQKIFQLIRQGELGAIRRVAWTVTDWFRSQAYYDSGGWRATWRGEGGGVLINQAVHNLDLWQWFFGLPQTVRAQVVLGKYHHIEVEDEVTAIFSSAGGMTGTFTTSTGEAPGVNRLEIAAENGLVRLEGGRLFFSRNEVPMSEHARTSIEGYVPPARWEIEIPLTQTTTQPHAAVLQNFTQALRGDAQLLAPAEEGLASVELINGILQSALQDRSLDLPIEAKAYRRFLRGLQKNSIEPGSRAPISCEKWTRRNDFGTAIANHRKD
jgi:predicted dehydrogenase